jgi:signal transduction histidine kinase
VDAVLLLVLSSEAIRREPTSAYNGSNGSLPVSGIANAHVLRSAIFAAVLGDPAQLRPVVLNVLLNALDAIAEAEAGHRQISLVTHRREPDLVEISVRDTGVGVKDGDLERIFERYFTTKTEGLGMGSSISRSIVHAHGGRIWATNNEGGGTTVVIELPGDDRSAQW